jgi:hypothetical protein
MLQAYASVAGHVLQSLRMLERRTFGIPQQHEDYCQDHQDESKRDHPAANQTLALLLLVSFDPGVTVRDVSMIASDVKSIRSWRVALISGRLTCASVEPSTRMSMWISGRLSLPSLRPDGRPSKSVARTLGRAPRPSCRRGAIEETTKILNLPEEVVDVLNHGFRVT